MKKNESFLAALSLALLASSLLAGATPLSAAAAQAAVSEVPRVVIQGEPFSGLERQEPMLAVLLLGVVQENSDHQSFLTAQPYLSGVTNGSHGRYKYHGALLPRANGDLGFIFDLDNLADQSTITYSGAIRPHAEAVIYTKVSRESMTAKPQVEKAQWQWMAAAE